MIKKNNCTHHPCRSWGAEGGDVGEARRSHHSGRRGGGPPPPPMPDPPPPYTGPVPCPRGTVAGAVVRSRRSSRFGFGAACCRDLSLKTSQKSVRKKACEYVTEKCCAPWKKLPFENVGEMGFWIRLWNMCLDTFVKYKF